MINTFSDIATNHLQIQSFNSGSLDDVDIAALSRSDMHLALQHGILLTYIDGEQSKEEVELIDQMIAKLGLSKEEMQPLLDSANQFAQSTHKRCQ